jgi:hypothetical protein
MMQLKRLTPLLLAIPLALSPIMNHSAYAKNDKSESHSQSYSQKDRDEHDSKSKHDKSDKSKGNGREKQEAVDKLVKELGLKNRGQLHKLLGALNSGDIRELEASDIPLTKLKGDLEAAKTNHEAKQRITKLAGAVDTILSKEKKTPAEISAAVTDVLEILE